MALNVIDTREKLRSYLLMKMGYPQLNVELTPEQIDLCIDEAILEFTEVAIAAQDEKVFVMELNGSSEYILDSRIKSILALKSSSSSSGISGISWGGIFLSATELYAKSILPLAGAAGSTDSISVSSFIGSLSQLSTLKSVFSLEINYRWNEWSKRLSIPGCEKGPVLLQVSLRYEPQEVDSIYGQQWVRSYALALAKKNLGTIWSKYDTTLINSSKLNYELMRQDADAELTALKAELIEKWQEPLWVSRG